MSTMKQSNPSWQQMDVAQTVIAPGAVDDVNIPVLDNDVDDEPYSFFEQHRTAVVVLLALTALGLLALASLAISPSSTPLSTSQPSFTSAVDSTEKPIVTQLTDLLPGRGQGAGAERNQQQAGPQQPGFVDSLKDRFNELVGGHVADTTLTRASTLHTAPNEFYVIPFAHLLADVAEALSSSTSSVYPDVSSALSAARTYRSTGAAASSASSAVYIYLYPTIHFQSSPIRLTVEDSGASASQPLVITTMPEPAVAYFSGLKRAAASSLPKESATNNSDISSWLLHSPDRSRAVLSGGRLLRGWTLTDKADVYQLRVDDSVTVNQLFVSNRRATRSRLPSNPLDFYRVVSSSGGQKTSMSVEPSVLTGISNLPQVEFIVYHSWTASRHYYKSHQPGGHVETDNPTMWDFGFKQGAYLRFSVENAAEGMDRPGTWYFDTDKHTVYYWAEAGAHPDELEVIMPVIDTVLAVTGESDEAKRVAYVEVRECEIAHSSWHLARGESADYQATSWLGFATVHIQYARNLLFEGVHIRHTGSYAWWCEKGCTDVTLTASQLTDTASGGVRVGKDRVMQAGAVPSPPDVLRRVYILNNHIHHIGHVFPDGVGVLQHRVEDSIISLNTIHHTYYSGISAGWEWGYDPSGSRNNTISHNYIHDIGRGLLTDQAGIYTLGSSNGGVITHNVIHNVHSWAGLDWGIYLDEGSVGWTVTDNIMYNTGWASFFLHYGKENVVSNNVFARAGPLRGDYAVDWQEKHLSMTAEHNIVYDTYKPDDGAAKEPHVTFEAGPEVHVKLDYNTYWSVHALDQRFGGHKSTLAEWQKSGQDEHSQYADPLFLHADECNFFELDPSSPAIKIGFKPIERLEAWLPGCDDPSKDDDEQGGDAPIIVPASAEEQKDKAMNTDKQAAEFMKREKEEKEEKEKKQQQEAGKQDEPQKDTAKRSEQTSPENGAESVEAHTANTQKKDGESNDSKSEKTKNNSGANATAPAAGDALEAQPGAFYVVPFSSLLLGSSAPSSTSSVYPDVSSALSAARTYRSTGAAASSASSAVYIYLYPTIHFQSSPIRLTVEDSGASASQPLVITTMPEPAVAYFSGLKRAAASSLPKESATNNSDISSWLLHSPDRSRAVLSGGRLLRGWTLTDKADVYQLRVDDSVTVNQLFVSNRRATRSRLPSNPLDFYRVVSSSGGQKTSMSVEPSVLTGISNLPQVEFIVYHSWTASRHYYKSHQPGGHVETDNPTMWDFGFKQGAYLRFSVENAAEGMDRPGTWYFDTDKHTVYYWAEAGAHPDELEVIMPVIDTVLAVTGESDEAKRVAYVEVRECEIAHSSWHLARGESADYQATSWLGFATVHIQYARNLLFEGVHIRHTGSYAWWCEKGCTDVTLTASQLTDTASGGVRVGKDRVMQAGAVPSPPDVLRRVYILNNHIHHIGHVFPDGVGVLQHRVEDSIISLNTIHHTYYSGISAGWEWGYDPSGSRNNTISHNYIHDIGRGLLTDQAGIYTLGSSNGGVITHNVIHNVHSWAGLDWGIYLDEGSVGWTVTDNIMYNTGWASFFLHYGKENVVSNNVFARAGPLRGDYAVDWQEKHLSMTAEHNIVYDTYKPDDGAAKEPHVTFEAGPEVHVKLDYNTYWSVHALDQRFGGHKSTLAEWQKSGQDEHSQYADPLFLHADECNFFELDPSSPAIKIGFKPIERLEAWLPGCDDPSKDDDEQGGDAPIIVPASAEEQKDKAMNTDKQAAEFMKREKEEKEEKEKKQQQEAGKQDKRRPDVPKGGHKHNHG